MIRFTGLGPFRSGIEARTYWASKPRNGSAIVIEERDLSRHGVTFGCTSKVIATA